MSNDSNIVKNLIDLSAEDDPHSPLQNPPTFTPPLPLIPISAYDGRESLENNPFDCIQKQANRPDDPFELLSREASYQPHCSESNGEGGTTSNQIEVRIGNLLCMSDDSIKVDEDTIPEFNTLQLPPSRFREPITSVSSIGSTIYSSPCNDSAFTSRNESSKTINKAFITENTISSFSEDSRVQSAMNKGFVESYSSFDHSSAKSTPENVNQSPLENSDSSGKGRSQKPMDARKRLLKLSLSNSTSNSPLCRRQFDDDNSSPLSSVFSEAENLADHFASRCGFDSGKSFDDSCDDLMSIKPNWIDSETDIDSDLEMMKIPILQEIPSPVVNQKTMPWSEKKVEDIPPKSVSTNNSPDLEALKEKVQQHRAEKNNNHEIKTLIDNLKLVIKDCANGEKKAEANNLLESLSNLMNDKNGSGTTEQMETLTPPPQPIVRQGTFDMEIKDNDEREESERQEEQQNKQSELQPEEEVHVDQNISTGTHSVHSVQSPESDQVSDIVEQIGRLLGNQNVNVLQANISNASNVNGTINPTYIVVMNTPIPAKHRPSINSSEYPNDGSPELTHGQIRRRSQSLSIHDKEKLFTAPVPPSPLRNDKTPARAPMLRRNSFSSTNPTTPSIPMNRRSVYGTCNASDAASKQSQMQRRSVALETHHEKQQNTLQQQPPMGVASISFNAKKLKFKQSTESIVKASGPMKATIPVKKVAPMIVTTNVDSPTEEPSNRFRSVTSTPNVQLNPSKGYPSACSTPMIEASPIKRSGIAKSRYSFIAATPTPKNSNLATSSSQARRRTMSEMRSPKKIGDRPSTSGITKPGTVKTVKLPQNFSKTLNKMAPTTSKGVLRLSKPSPPTGTVDKNKENKLPRPGR
ncbi:uncharacterized protein LOC129910559 [Episyrphus balteatus]|uniref:uncharacterized protein LOC129910559 n=1 Tax=Episyrphus balteatus TaxID=286459 RepID=UPI002485F9B9|nr:uncharacterized protein LOC129910559 [Episyrphus balteatus]